nr:hypothetical protein [uncultured Albidiferax sp.]
MRTVRSAALLSFLALAVPMLTACAHLGLNAGRTETVLPLHRAWMDGRVVEYITTDISDLAMAQMAGVNYVPRLADALGAAPGQSLAERVYKFAQDEQISIFPSAPHPVGADNQDRSYSPLWRVVMVHWANPANARELTSEEALLAAEERKELTLEITNTVVNCPVTRVQGGLGLKGVR